MARCARAILTGAGHDSTQSRFPFCYDCLRAIPPAHRQPQALELTMPKLTSTLVLAAALVCVCVLNAQPAPAAMPAAKKAASTGGTSPHETISAYIGGSRRNGGQLVTISYGR